VSDLKGLKKEIERIENAVEYSKVEIEHLETFCNGQAAEIKKLNSIIDELRDEIDRLNALAESISRGVFDVSPCINCGGAVVCISDGMAMCKDCAQKAGY
jgi:archaellum component FlaC